jgi:hypothetical protein
LPNGLGVVAQQLGIYHPSSLLIGSEPYD